MEPDFTNFVKIKKSNLYSREGPMVKYNSINDKILYYMQQTVVHGMTKNGISAQKS